MEKYKILIFDFEVFAHDWLVVFSNLEENEIKVIHNDIESLKKIMFDEQYIFGGYNVKHYDNWIAQTILCGCSPEQVKECNDWIITKGNNGWEFPLIVGERRKFTSFDLMDDIAVPISLKAIEANIGIPIVESSVPFDIDRPLTESELQEVIKYCKWDVSSTVKLYNLRKSYLDAKVSVGSMKGWDEKISLPMTNPRLTSKFLDAKLKSHNDEFVYEPPDCLRLDKYKEVLEFYKDVDYDKNLELEVAGVMQHYGWGGIHSAIEHYQDASDDQYKIVDIDVGSYYPSLMIEYGYISRNIPSADGYKAIYHDRLKAKHEGNKKVANNYKLILNSTYGALKSGTRIARNAKQAEEMGNRYKITYANDLFDARMANAVCITGQLFLTDLVEKLEAVEGMKLIQTNTDGIMVKYPVAKESEIVDVVHEWEQRTRMNMEYTDIKRICCQKDVNNYIMVTGATYLFKDGKKIVTKKDEDSITTKGGWVSLWQGGTWQNNSLVILHKALVQYFVNGISPEDTINSAENIHDFQIICKTTSKFTGTVWMVDGVEQSCQNCNRVYAVKDTKYGMIFKLKGSSKYKFPDIPPHCMVDNFNTLSIDQIDKDYYIALAWKRINDFLGKKIPKTTRKKKGETEMATTKPKEETFSNLNLMQKLCRIRHDFLKAEPKKTGKNRGIGFMYYTLDDILPIAIPLFDKYGVFFTREMNETATMTIINADNPDDERFTFSLPMMHITPNKGQNPIQAQGAEITYYRRYLWMMVLDICEFEEIDAGIMEEDSAPPVKPPATKEERQEAVKQMTSGAMTEAQKKSIIAGLKKLRECGEQFNDYIESVKATLKNESISKEDAENIMLEIGNKLTGGNQ